MCFDRQIFSLYHDGELPSPWKEKLKAHLQSCAECRAALARYGNLSERFEKAPEETVLAAQDRVWKKLSAPELVFAKETFSRKPAKAIWNRSVTLPLPAAAAAALIIAVAFFALAGIRDGNRSRALDSVAGAMGLDDQSTVSVPVQDMSGVLKYLSAQDNENVMIISLPESKNFSRAGEPALINAADYSRRTNSR